MKISKLWKTEQIEAAGEVGEDLVRDLGHVIAREVGEAAAGAEIAAAAAGGRDRKTEIAVVEVDFQMRNERRKE